MEIGFIGLGHMGSGMAVNLLRAGHRLRVYNRTRARTAPLAEQGAKVATTPGEAARDAEILISMLADDDAVESVLFDDDGAFAELREDSVHISASTLSEAFVERLTREHELAGHGFLSAPVFGRPDVAAAGKLRIVAGGPKSLIERCRPVFEAIGQDLFVAGERPASANVVKLAGNFMIMSMLESLGEAYALMRKSAVAPTLFLEIVNSMFRSPVYENYGGIIAAERFEPAGFPAHLGLKDVRFVLASAERAQAPMPIASLVRDRYLGVHARGWGDLDWAAIARMSAVDAGLIK